MLSRSVSFALAIAVALTVVARLPVGAVAPGNPAFQRTWQRPDQPVTAGQVSRTWMWGPEANGAAIEEPYSEAPNGTRIVQYYDKSRMEITDPNADPQALWYVTNGLLVVELMSGRLQIGHNTFEQHDPAVVNVAGDANDPNGPTYATFATLRLLPPLPDGAPITQRVNRTGQVSDDPALLGQGVVAAEHVDVPGIDHQVASPFWAFMTSSGVVYESGTYQNDLLFPDPYYATGYPVTEAYWADVLVGGTERLVLVQCFERRCLTYTPGNPEGWQVEAGNVGLHYHTWRYEQIPGEDEEEPTATATTTATLTATVTATTTVPAPTATATATVTATATATASPSPTTPVEPATQYDYLRQWGSQHDPGTEMGSPSGAAIDAAGNVYITDYSLDRVQVYDVDGRFLRQWGASGTSSRRFMDPKGIAVDEDGYVYVADSANFRIQKFTSDGTYVTQWPVNDDSGSPAWAEDVAVYDGVVAVSAHDAGFAAINLYTTDGVLIDQVGEFSSDPANLQEPRGLDFDDYGQLWVADPANDCKLHRYSAEIVYELTVGGCGPADSDFSLPLDVTADGSFVYVADATLPGIKVLSLSGDYVGTVEPGGPAGQPGSFFAPYGIAVGPGGIALADFGRLAVLKFTTWDNGAEFKYEWQDDRRGRFAEVSGVALGSAGNIYVADAELDQISRFSPDGELINAWGVSGTDVWQLSQPRDLAVTDAGRVYVVDQGNDRIRVFDPQGNFQFGWGSNGPATGHFDTPVGIALDGAGNVYVTDGGNYRVQVFTADGAFLRSWGSQGNGDLQFQDPRGIAFHDGKVYVADSNLETIKVFSDLGVFQFQFGSPGTGDGQFADVSRITIDAYGTLYVTDRNNHRVQTFTAEGVHIATFGASGVGDGQFDRPTGIAVGDDGNVFVGDFGNYRVQVFEPLR